MAIGLGKVVPKGPRRPSVVPNGPLKAPSLLSNFFIGKDLILQIFWE